jgi:hypothetical protein
MATDGTSNLLRWQELYQLAMVELDGTKLPQRIAIAHEAILDRIQESLTTASANERQQLHDALHGLRILRQEINAWQSKPDHNSNGMSIRKTG